jgi:hypothetical protein
MRVEHVILKTGKKYKAKSSKATGDAGTIEARDIAEKTAEVQIMSKKPYQRGGT